MRKLSEIDVNGKRVLMRLDLNVPLKDGKITSDARIQAALPTIRYVLDHGGAVMIMAHLGRPTEGEYDEAFSLAPVATYLGNLLGKNVPLIKDYLDKAPAVAAGDIVMLENCRFNKGEKKNDPALAEKYAALCDVFVSDGFGVVHRAQASTYGVAEKAKTAVNVGASLYEPDLLNDAKAMLDSARARGVNIPLPVDVVVATEFSADAKATVKAVADVADNEMILDIGPKTAENYARVIAEMKTVVWNGPVGVFEMAPFAAGTKALSAAIAACPGFTFAGGGDTIAAIGQFGIEDKVDYISTGGGSMLEYLEGKKLPGLDILGAY